MEQNCIPLLLLSSIYYFYSSPPLIRSYIFLNTLYIKFYGEILYEYLAEFFAILFYHRYTLNTSNWKYSTRAPCFYIFAFAIGFFRRWLSKPPPPAPLSEDAFGIHRVFAYTLHEDLQKRFPPQYLFFPRGSFQSFWIEEYVHLYYLYRESELSPSPLCTWHGSNCPSIFQPQPRFFHRYFPVTIAFSSLPPSLLIIIL